MAELVAEGLQRHKGRTPACTALCVGVVFELTVALHSRKSSLDGKEDEL